MGRDTEFMGSKTNCKSVNSHEINLQFSAVRIKIPANIFTDMRKLVLKFIQNGTSSE